MSEAAEVLRWLPDLPRWVETRSMLLSGDASILGDLPGLVVTDSDRSLLSVVGRPPEQLVRTALATALPGADLIAAPEDAPHVAAAIGIPGIPAVLHRLDDHTVAHPSERVAPGETRLLTSRDPLDHLPPALRIEIAMALTFAPVAAAFAQGLPVSFCYPGSTSETLWDIGIDTLEDFRRAGYASRATRFMIEHMRALDREPVWCALTTNLASLAMAAKLGFRECDRIVVFEHSPEGAPATM